MKPFGEIRGDLLCWTFSRTTNEVGLRQCFHLSADKSVVKVVIAVVVSLLSQHLGSAGNDDITSRKGM